MFVKPKPVLLETWGISTLDGVSIGAFFEALPKESVREAQQTEKMKPSASGVVRDVCEFMRHNGPDARIGSCQYRRPGVHLNEILHLFCKKEPKNAEPRLEVIGVAAEGPNPDIRIRKFREGPSSNVSNNPLCPRCIRLRVA